MSQVHDLAEELSHDYVDNRRQIFVNKLSRNPRIIWCRQCNNIRIGTLLQRQYWLIAVRQICANNPIVKGRNTSKVIGIT